MRARTITSSVCPQRPASDAAADRLRALGDAALTIERAILGTAVLDGTGHSAGMLCATLQESDFSGPLHRQVFHALRRLLGRGVTVIDYAVIVAELQRLVRERKRIKLLEGELGRT